MNGSKRPASRRMRRTATAVGAVLALGVSPQESALGLDSAPARAIRASADPVDYPPSSLSFYVSDQTGAPDSVGWKYLQASGTAETRQARIGGVQEATPTLCMRVYAEEIRTETRSEGAREVEVDVWVKRFVEGCASAEQYGFDPLDSQASVRATVEMSGQAHTAVRPAGGTWTFESSAWKPASATVDLAWTGTGQPRPDTWGCFFYGPPFFWPCSKPHLAAVARSASVTGSILADGIDVPPLDEASGEMLWGAFVP